MKIKKILSFLIMLIITIALLETVSMAASFDASASKTTLNIGDTTSVTIKVNDCFGKFTVSTSDSSIVSVNNTSIWIEHGSQSGSFTITAKKAGKATITITAKNVSDTAGDNDITGSKTVTITVPEPKKEEPKEEPKKEETKKEETKTETTKEQTTTNKEEEAPKPVVTKSSDATLKSLTVDGKTYSNPKNSITANNVSSDTATIKISAQTNDSKAKVTGTGTKELVTGTNKFTLKVTAEDGSTKSYTIKVTKLEEEDTTPNIVEEQKEEEKQEEPELRLSSLILEGVELIPKFEAEIFEYTVYITSVEELKIDAKANIEDATIEITGNTNLKEGENTALIKLIKDEKTVVYKITINKAGLSTIQGNTENKPDKKLDDKDETKISFIGKITDWWNKSGMLTIVLAGILGLFSAAVSFVITVYKYTKPAVNTSKHLNEDKN